MFELVLNRPFTTVFSGPTNTPPSDGVLYINGSNSNLAFTTTQINSTTWSMTFTPVSSGVYSFYAFGEIQFRAQCSAKSLYDLLTNIEDEALGSWSWNKSTGALTLLRQNGSTLASFTVQDDVTESSRERLF